MGNHSSSELKQVAATLAAAYWNKTKNVSTSQDERDQLVDIYFEIHQKLESKAKA